MLTPIKLDIVRGDTKPLTATVTTNGVATSLVGGKLFFTAKTDVSNPDPGVFQLTWVDGGASSGITVPTPSSGVANITIPPSATSGLGAFVQTLQWDLEFVSAAGDVFSVARGTLTVTPDVTIST